MTQDVKTNSVYRIVGWAKYFENNRTREIRSLSWVAMPVKMDGDGYTELLDHENGAAHFGAWCAIVEIAAKCDPRGTLLRDGRRPHDIASLSRVSRIKPSVFEEAIPRLISVGWLETQTYDGTELTEERQEAAATSQEGAALSRARACDTTSHNTTQDNKTQDNTTSLSTLIDYSGAKSQKPATDACEKSDLVAADGVADVDSMFTPVESKRAELTKAGVSGRALVAISACPSISLSMIRDAVSLARKKKPKNLGAYVAAILKSEIQGKGPLLGATPDNETVRRSEVLKALDVLERTEKR